MGNSTDPKFIAFGDSHAVVLGSGADALGVDYLAWALFAGHELDRDFFVVEADELIVNSKRGQAVFCRRTDGGQSVPGSAPHLPILSTAGFNANNFGKKFHHGGLSITRSSNGQFVSSACFESVVSGARTHVLQFYRALIGLGWSVFAAPSPPRFDPKWASVAHEFQNILAHQLTAVGVKIVDVRAETTDPDGMLRQKFAGSDDRLHGNAKYGALVVRRFMEMIDAHPVASG